MRDRPDDQTVRFNLVLATVNLGNFAMERAPDEAIAHDREALAILAFLRHEAPAHQRYAEWEARTKSNLGLDLGRNRQDRGGRRHRREAVTAAEQVFDKFLRLDVLATCRNNLGEVLESARRFVEAEAIFRLALDDYRTLTSRFPNDVDYRWSVAMVLTNIASVVHHQARDEEARQLLDESKKIFGELTASQGANAAFQRHVAKNASVLQAVQRQLNTKIP